MDNLENLTARLALSISGSSTHSGKSTLYSTPVHGGGVAHSAPIEFGQSLAWVRDASRVCLGKVGGNHKVCLRLKGECGVKAHQRQRIELDEDGNGCLVVLAGSQDVGRVSPVLNTASLEESLIEDILGRGTKENWGETFALLEDSRIRNEDEELRIKTLTATAKKQPIMRTPSQLSVKVRLEDQVSKLAEMLIDTAEAMVEAGKAKESLEVAKGVIAKTNDPEERTTALVTAMEPAVKRLDLITESHFNLSDLVLTMANILKTDVGELESLAFGMKGLISMIQGDIGKKNAEDGVDMAPTVWGAVREAWAHIIKMQETLHLLGDNVVALREVANDAVPQRVESGHGGGRYISDGVLPATALRSNRSSRESWNQRGVRGFSSLGSGYGNDGYGNNRSNGNNGGSGRGFNGGGYGGGGRGRGGGAGGYGGPNDGGDDPSESGSCLGRYEEDSRQSREDDRAVIPDAVDEILARLDRLERAHAGAGGSGDQTVFFGSHVFRAKRDLSAFLEEFLGLGYLPSGLFVSPHQILNAIHAELSHSLPGMKDFKALKDLKVTTRDYHATTAALRNKPTVFESKRLETHAYTTPCATACRFKAIPSYAEWGLKSDTDSLYHKFSRELDRFEGSMQSAVASEFSDYPTLQIMAASMLAKSTRFVRGLFEYMTECYEHLNPSFPSSTETWDLVCFSVEEIFMNEFTAPRSAMVERDFTDVRKLAVDVIWVNLRSMSVVDDFNQTGIKNHHSMNGAQIRFVIKQAGSQNRQNMERTIQTQNEKIKSMETKMEDHESQFLALKKKVQSLESRIDKAKKVG